MTSETGGRSAVRTPRSGAPGHHRVRVLVGHPWPLFRDGATQVIKGWPECELVGVVRGDEFVSALIDLRPDVALVDPTCLSEDDKEEIFACIREEDMRIVFISQGPEHESYDAIARGVLGYVPEDCDETDMRDAIAAAARGGTYLAKASVAALIEEIRLRHRIDRPRLTSREQQILTLVADGYTVPQIAEEIHLASSTIRTHLRNTYKKLGVGGQAEAVAVALRLGLII